MCDIFIGDMQKHADHTVTDKKDSLEDIWLEIKELGQDPLVMSIMITNEYNQNIHK